jgi:Rho GTPase-activating protein 1
MSDIHSIVDRVVHVAPTFDPSTRLPLVVVDSTGFPDPQSNSYSCLVPAVIEKLPKTNYALLFFACGAPNKPSWSWVARTYSMLDRSAKKRVNKIYVVHESWWVRAISEMLRGVVSSKFRRKVIHVSNLSQLAKLIDITLINIKPTVYLHDIKIEDHITIPRHHSPVFCMPLTCDEYGQIQLPAVWTDTLNYLRVKASTVKDVFKRTEDSILLYILRDCYDRGHLLDLDDYGPQLTASLLKLYLVQLPTPILPANEIDLPIQDTAEYCVNTFISLPAISKRLLMDLIDLLANMVFNSNIHSPGSLAACIGPNLLGLGPITNETMATGVRFTRNLIEFWPQVSAAANYWMNNNYHNQLSIRKHRTERFSSISNYDDSLSSPLSGNAPQGWIRSTSYISTPDLHSPFSIGLTDSRSTSLSSSSSSSTSSTISESARMFSMMPPPLAPIKLGPPPPSRKERITGSILQPTTTNISRPNISNKPIHGDPLYPRKLAPETTRTIPSTRRGKMVAELAKLYEEKCNTAQILVSIDRR